MRFLEMEPIYVVIFIHGSGREKRLGEKDPEDIRLGREQLALTQK